MNKKIKKTKSLKKYIESRLDKEEIAEIERQVQLEVKILQTLQNAVSDAMDNYMKKNKVGFNELVRQLDVSPTHIAKIKKGEANLTLASLAQLFALLGQEPHVVFKKR